MSGEDRRPAGQLGPGATIGDELTVLGRLGRGGLSEVHLVWSARYGATFACKLLRPALCDDPASRRALLREGRILKAVAHPRIVRLFEAAGCAQPYLLLQYLDGPSASWLLRQHGRFPVEAAVRLALHVATALQTSRRHSSTSIGAGTCTWT
jgi:eukaryotic-like serine/threonine-protein kinase